MEGASMVLATWRGVTWAWPRRLARVRACFTTFAASGVRACCTVQPPDLIFFLSQVFLQISIREKLELWKIKEGLL